MSVTFARLSGTRAMTEGNFIWQGTDWDHAEFLASLKDGYRDYVTHITVGPELSYRDWLSSLIALVTPGATDGTTALQRAHCTAMRIMMNEEIARIDRECDELFALLDSISWEA